MRLDKFLKVSKIIKRRTISNEIIDKGRVKVNNKVIKPSYNVKVGDVVEIQFGEKISKFEIIIVPEKQTKNMPEMVKII